MKSAQTKIHRATEQDKNEEVDKFENYHFLVYHILFSDSECVFNLDSALEIILSFSISGADDELLGEHAAGGQRVLAPASDGTICDEGTVLGGARRKMARIRTAARAAAALRRWLR